MPDHEWIVSPNAAVSSVKQLMIAFWPMRVTLAGVEQVVVAIRSMMASHPDGIGYLVILDAHVRLPDDAARARISEFLTIPGTRLRTAAIVVEGSGFGASAFRAVVTSVTLLARGETQVKVFSDVASATKWLEEQWRPRGASNLAASLVEETARLRREWTAAHGAAQ